MVRCHRCGMPVRYKTKSGAYKATLAHRDRLFLCPECRSDYREAVKNGTELPDSNVVYESKTCAVARCPSCGGVRKLIGSTMVLGFAKLHGRCGERYLCRSCKAKTKIPDRKVCSVCGNVEEFKNRDAARKFAERHPEWNPYVCPKCRKKAVEERNTLVCSVCGKEIPARTRYQKRLLRWCGEGKSVYVCAECKAPKADYSVSRRQTKRIPLIKTPEYLELANALTASYREYVSSGFSEAGLNRFLAGVGDILNRRNVFDFDLNVVNGVVEGVVLHNVSLYGEVYVRLG